MSRSRRSEVKGRRILDILVFGAWIAVTLAGVFHHEPFRDEAHKWLLARDVGSVGDYLAMTRADSTPGLWLLMLMPFAKLGAPFWTAHLVSWLCAAAGAATLWFAAPLPRLVKALVLFSYFFLFDLAVLSPNYSAMMLLCFACLALHPVRWRHPLRYCLALLLLMNLALPAVFIASTLGGLFLLEAFRRRPPFRLVVPGALVLLAAGLGVAAQLFLASSTAVLGEVADMPHGLAGFLAGVNGRLPWMQGWHLAAWGAVLALLAASLILRPRALLLALGACVPAALVFWRLPEARFLTCIAIGVLMTLWFAALEPEPQWRTAALRRAAGALARLRTATVFLLVLPFGFAVVFGVAEIGKDYRMTYADARNAAAFIAANALDNRKMIVFPDYLGVPLLPYLEGRRVFFAGANRWGTYDLRDDAWVRGEDATPAEVLQRAFAVAAGDPGFLLILGSHLELPAEACRKLYTSDASRMWTHWDEDYHVYECRGMS